MGRRQTRSAAGKDACPTGVVKCCACVRLQKVQGTRTERVASRGHCLRRCDRTSVLSARCSAACARLFTDFMNMHQSAQQHPACSQSSGTLPPACRRAPSSRRASRSPRAPLSPLSSEASVQGPGCISSYHAGRPRCQQSLCAALSLPYVTAPISQQVCNSRKHRAGASQALVCASSSREAAATVEAQQGEQAAPTRALVSEPEVHGALPSDLPGNPYWWTELEGAGGYEDDDGEDVTVLTPEEVGADTHSHSHTQTHTYRSCPTPTASLYL